jgi:anaerobic magnesium-protoporphyrin IX monomethyl ester cyclase
MNSSNVLEMIHRIVREYGIRGFLFHDDNFFLDLAWAHSVLEGIVQSDLDLSLGKLFIRADTLCKMDNDFLRLLVRAGVKRLVMGVESGSQRINNLLKKHLTLEQVIEANRKLISYPIKPAYMFMMGIPTETPEEVAQSIHFADQLIKENPKATRSFNLYMPYPGTELFKIAVQHGLREPKTLSEWAEFNYHKVFKESPWILPETERLVELMNFALMCSKHDNAFGGFRRQDAGSVLFTKLYTPLAQYRVRNMDVRFPFEVTLIRALRFFLRRE